MSPFIPRRAAIAALFLVVPIAGLTAAAAPASAQLSLRTGTMAKHWNLGVGIKLTRIRHRAAPNELRILTVVAQKHTKRRPSGPRMDVKPAGPDYPMYRVPSAVGEAGGAVAAVNGDFVLQSRPAHLSMIDGELWSSGVHGGAAAIGFSSDGTRAFVGHPQLEIRAGRVHTTGFPVARWNVGVPNNDEVIAYTSRGGSLVRPPGTTSPTGSDPAYCAVRLVPTAGIDWSGKGKASLVRTYTVDAQPEPCPPTPLGIGGNGNVVLATRANGAHAGEITALAKGQNVQVAWKIRGWPGVTDVLGAQPVILENGKNVAPAYHPGDSYFLNNNPRTAVGISSGCRDAVRRTICRVYVLTVDGRQTSTDWSRGMRLPDLADALARVGAVDAVNLDGGGGTEMWVAHRRAYCQRGEDAGGCVVTRPSDGHERGTVLSLTVLPGVDRGEPKRLRR